MSSQHEQLRWRNLKLFSATGTGGNAGGSGGNRGKREVRTIIVVHITQLNGVFVVLYAL